MSDQRFSIFIENGQYVIKQEYNDAHRTVYRLHLNKKDEMKAIYQTCKTILVSGIGNDDILRIQATSNVRFSKTKSSDVAIVNDDADWAFAEIAIPLFYFEDFIRVIENFIISIF